jgi:hypothetical protein
MSTIAYCAVAYCAVAYCAVAYGFYVVIIIATRGSEIKEVMQILYVAIVPMSRNVARKPSYDSKWVT